MPNQQPNLEEQVNQPPQPSTSLLQRPRFNLKYILIILILAVLVGGGIFAYTKYINKQITSFLKFPEIKKDQTANWQTYRNEKYGFEFKYPTEFSLTEGKNLSSFNYPSKILFDGPDINSEFIGGKKTTIFFQIFENKNSLSLHDYIVSTNYDPKLNPNYNDPKYRDLKKVGWTYEKNDSIEMWSKGLTEALDGFEGEVYLMDAKNPNIIERSYFGSSGWNDGEKDRGFANSQYERFKRILSTFKFIK